MLKSLMERREALLAKASAIVEAADTAKVELTAEQVTEINTLTAEATTLGEKIAAVKGAHAARAAVASLRGEVTTVAPRRDPVLVTPSTVRPAWLDHPSRGYNTPREFLHDVIRAEITGRVNERLASMRVPVDPSMAAGSDEQGGYDNSVGGYLVPQTFLPTLLTVGPPVSPVGATTQIPMGSPVVNIPARVDKNHSTSVSGGFRVYRRAETSDFTASRASFESVKMEATSLVGLAYATEEILVDSVLAFAALIEAGFRDEFEGSRASEFLLGDGVGKPLGAFHANNASIVTVAKEAAQAADTVNFTNIVKMRARCWGYQNAVWIANYDVIPQLMAMNASTNFLVWQPSAREDHPDILLGRPIIFCEFAKTVGDLNDIMLCNWTQYLEGTYQPMQSAESMHVRFVAHERAFKFWLRNTGMPWWRSALTPKNGSTLSPFVNLAERA